MQPKSVRLNRQLRNIFINHVLEDVVPKQSFPEIDAFVQRTSKHAYELAYGSIKEILLQLPSWAVFKSKWLFLQLVNNKNEKTSLKFELAQPELCLVKVESYRSMPDPCYPLPALDAEHPVCIEYYQLLQHQIDWNVKRNEFHKQLRTLINDCNTTAQLFTGWPEAAKYAHLFPVPSGSKVDPPKITALELDLGLSMTRAVVNQMKDN